MTSLLILRDASFGYAAHPVVAGVDLTVDAGAFLGIVGPNGSGKTTLFRGMLGLIPPLTGTVERLTDAVGYVPQRESLDALYPLRADEVVQMGAYGRLRGWRGLPRAERELARTCLLRVGLSDRALSPFSSLSGGQRQRVLIARALMAKPRLLLLDEPTRGVDRSAEKLILDLLLELNQREGVAVLLVSHQLPLVRRAVDEVLWVSDRRVERGKAAELLAPESVDRLFSAEHRDSGEGN